MRVHLPALDHGLMGPATVRYAIRIHGHLGATVLTAFPALVPQHYGADTVLTALLDRSALYGVLAEVEALGLARGRAAARLGPPGHRPSDHRDRPHRPPAEGAVAPLAMWPATAGVTPVETPVWRQHEHGETMMPTTIARPIVACVTARGQERLGDR